jgi:hypothetical protein
LIPDKKPKGRDLKIAFSNYRGHGEKEADKTVLHKRAHRDKYKDESFVFCNQNISLRPLWLTALFGLKERARREVDRNYVRITGAVFFTV